MFFDLILLNRQHHSRLAFAWIAATRGVQHVNKNDLLRLDLVKLCDEITNYVSSESDSPRSRFSLRLSAILINGTIKIYRKNAEYIYDDIIKLLTTSTFVMPGLGIEEFFHTPPMPITKTKRKKRERRVEQETPESQLAQITIRELEAREVELEPVIHQARLDEITLREEHPRTQDTEAVGDLGNLGEDELAQLMETMGVQPLPTPRVRPAMIRPSPPSPIVPVSTTFTVEALVHAPADIGEPIRRIEPMEVPLPAPEVTEIQISHPELQEAPIPVPQAVQVVTEAPPTSPRRVLGEVPPEIVRMRDEEISLLRTRRKKTNDIANLLIDMKPQKFVRIDLCAVEDLKLVEVDPSPLPELKLRSPNLTNLFGLYAVRRALDDVRQEEIAKTPSLTESLVSKRKSVQLTPVETSAEERVTQTIPIRTEEVIMEEELLQIETPTPLMVSTPFVGRTREELVARAAEREIRSPTKKRRLLLDDDPEFVLRDLTSREFTPSVVQLRQETTIEPILPPVVAEKTRQQEIINKLVNKDPLTLEELCPEPINRLNISRTFSDLLVLCRYGYVSLISKEGSNELDFATKGPKMIG